VAVSRDGARKMLKLTVEEQPDSFGTAADGSDSGLTSLGKIGAKVMDMTNENAKQFGYAEKTQGALIAEVDPESLADVAGLKSGMLIVKVDQHPVKTAREVQDALTKGSLDKGVLFQVRTPQGGTTYVLVKSHSSR